MILVILQARLSSTRLPGKVLKPILGIPMLLQQIKRIQKAELIDKVVVATSVDPGDDELAQLCCDNGVECFRGSLDDVLGRFHNAAKLYSPQHVVRLTGDCPLIDPQIIDQVIRFHVDGNFDYTSNALIPTYPDGLDVEVIKYEVLVKAAEEAVLAAQREHVTLYIYQQCQRFKIGVVKGETDLSAFRWTVDEPEDFELVVKIYEGLYKYKDDFSMEDILEWLQREPEVMAGNRRFKRNEGLAQSLREEQQAKLKAI